MMESYKQRYWFDGGTETPEPPPAITPPPVEPGQSAVAQPTPPALPEIPADKFSTLPKEVQDLYNNAKAAIASSTQRYQEAAAVRKTYEERQKQADELVNTAKALIEQSRGQAAPPSAPSVPEKPPDFVQDPVGAYNYALQQIASQGDLIKKFQDQVGVKLAQNQYETWYQQEIRLQYPDVSTTELRIAFEDNPNLNLDDVNVWRETAKKISEVKKSKHEAEYKAYIAEKERVAKEAAGNQPQPSLASLPPGKKWIDMTDKEQDDALRMIVRPLLNRQ